MCKIRNVDPAIRMLKSVSLIYEEHTRIKVLSPIHGLILSREEYRPHSEDRMAVTQYYMALTQKADCLPGDDKFIPVQVMLQPEAGNLYSILSLAIANGSPSPDLGRAILHYTKFLCITSMSADLLKQLLCGDEWNQHMEPELQARLLNELSCAYINMMPLSRVYLRAFLHCSIAFSCCSKYQAVLSLWSKGFPMAIWANMRKSWLFLSRGRGRLKLLGMLRLLISNIPSIF